MPHPLAAITTSQEGQGSPIVSRAPSKAVFCRTCRLVFMFSLLVVLWLLSLLECTVPYRGLHNWSTSAIRFHVTNNCSNTRNILIRCGWLDDVSWGWDWRRRGLQRYSTAEPFGAGFMFISIPGETHTHHGMQKLPSWGLQLASSGLLQTQPRGCMLSKFIVP